MSYALVGNGDNLFDLKAMGVLAMDQKQVEDNIRDWLLEQSFRIEKMANSNAIFNFAATDPNGQIFHVIQNSRNRDAVALIASVGIPLEYQNKLENMDEKKRQDFLWKLRFALLNFGIGFSGVGLPFETVRLETQIFYDGLTKDRFFSGVLLIRRAIILIMWVFNQELQEPPRAFRIGFL